MVYRPVLDMIPASIDGIERWVCNRAVIIPDKPPDNKARINPNTG